MAHRALTLNALGTYQAPRLADKELPGWCLLHSDRLAVRLKHSVGQDRRLAGAATSDDNHGAHAHVHRLLLLVVEQIWEVEVYGSVYAVCRKGFDQASQIAWEKSSRPRLQMWCRLGVR